MRTFVARFFANSEAVFAQLRLPVLALVGVLQALAATLRSRGSHLHRHARGNCFGVVLLGVPEVQTRAAHYGPSHGFPLDGLRRNRHGQLHLFRYVEFSPLIRHFSV